MKLQKVHKRALWTSTHYHAAAPTELMSPLSVAFAASRYQHSVVQGIMLVGRSHISDVPHFEACSSVRSYHA